jgi:inosine triphosphate pyrophosphatase
MLHFITGSDKKFHEIKMIVPQVHQLDIDLVEIQELNTNKIIEAKLLEATKHHDGAFIVEDTSLMLSCLNGLPGPYTKWFQNALGNEKLVEIVTKLGDATAGAGTVIGYMSEHGEIKYFKGEVQGEIVAQKVDSNFGWDPIFKPNGCTKTYGEMSDIEKSEISMRAIAAYKLRDFLVSK